MDLRIIWAVRHFLYKAFFGRLPGIGYLGPPSFAKGLRRVRIGKRFGLFPGWRMEVVNGSVQIGNDVRIGNNFFLNCGSHLTIGNNVTISGNVFVGTTHHKIDYELGLHFKEWETVERPVHIKSGCFIGYGAVLLPGTVLEEGCVVGANAVVQGQFAPGTVIAASRAQAVRRRDGFAPLPE